MNTDTSHHGHERRSRLFTNTPCSQTRLAVLLRLPRFTHSRTLSPFRQANMSTTGDLLAAAEDYLELSKHPGMKERERLAASGPRRKGTIPVRPLTCPGLHIRQHPFTSTPAMGIRGPSSPTLPLPEWVPPTATTEFEHKRPFESRFFKDPLRQPFVVGGALPDSKGHFLERPPDGATLYTATHADVALDALNADPHRPTEWANRNVYGRDRSFRQAKLDRVAELAEGSDLFVPTARRLAPAEAAAAASLRSEIAAIASQRRRLQRASCGLSMASKKKHAAAAARNEAARRVREKAVADHVAEHEGKSLMYRIAFDKFDEDGSGHIDALELAEAVNHFGMGRQDEHTVRKDEDEEGGGRAMRRLGCSANFTYFCLKRFGR